MAVEVVALRWCSTRSIFCFGPWSGTTKRAAVSLVDGPRRHANAASPRTARTARGTRLSSTKGASALLGPGAYQKRREPPAKSLPSIVGERFSGRPAGGPNAAQPDLETVNPPFLRPASADGKVGCSGAQFDRTAHFPVLLVTILDSAGSNQ
jgi:hypothetical protein